MASFPHLPPMNTDRYTTFETTSIVGLRYGDVIYFTKQDGDPSTAIYATSAGVGFLWINDRSINYDDTRPIEVRYHAPLEIVSTSSSIRVFRLHPGMPVVLRLDRLHNTRSYSDEWNEQHFTTMVTDS